MGISSFSGRALVGSRNFQWAADGLSTIVKATEINPDKHLVGRLFYPSVYVEACAPKPSWPKSSWLSSIHEATGYASFLFLSAKTWQKWTLQPLFRAGLWMFGKCTHIPICENAALAASTAGGSGSADSSTYPVIIFSHGVGGTRSTYSVLCAEMASQGFVVLAVEHTDGTASCVHCAGKGGWRNYSGFGKGEVQHAKLAWRMREVETAVRLLESLNQGTLSSEHCQLAGGAAASTFLQGRLNLKEVALVGHSFGGATVTAAAAGDLQFRAVVALDPWWPAVPPQSPALERWKTHTPLLVIGSDAWNKPYNDKGDIICGRDLQRKILTAAHHDQETGGGALLLVVTNSSHDSFSDLPVLFSQFAWLMAKLGFVTKLDPALGMAAISSATSQFLHRHLETLEAPQLPPLITARLSDHSARLSDQFTTLAPRAADDTSASAVTAGAQGEVPNGITKGSGEWVVVPQNGASERAVKPRGVTADAGRTNGMIGGQSDGGATLGVASEATRTMSGSAPGQALDPSAGCESADADHFSKAPHPPLRNGDVFNIRTNSAQQSLKGGQPLQGGSNGAPREAEKVSVGAEDEKDMRGLLGDLAVILQLNA